jgi:hypothetical protein
VSGEVNVPKVGPVKKPVLFGIVGAGLAYVLWRRYQAGQAAAADATAASGDFADPGATPGGGSGSQLVGLPGDQEPPSGDTFGFKGTTNSQWTQYAATQLTMSGTQDYTAILTVLGQYLAGKPLTTSQQQTVQAAIAVAGYPPEGQHPIIPGGDTKITIAPTGVTGKAINSTSVSLQWSPVSGADGYRIYRNGVAQVVGEAFSNSGQVGGLSPGTTYSFQVAAHTSSGQIGPKSASVRVKTPAVKMSAPGGLRVTATTASTVTLHWNPVHGSSLYRIYRQDLGNESVGDSRDTTWQSRGLAKGHTYTFRVVAVDNIGVNGPAATVRATTKKK